MIIVTGGAGFVGANIVKELNLTGITDILVVDDLSDGTKFKNIASSQIADYQDKDDFLQGTMKWFTIKSRDFKERAKPIILKPNFNLMALDFER